MRLLAFVSRGVDGQKADARRPQGVYRSKNMSELSDIDQHNLEEEWLIQPKMHEEHAEALVEAKRLLQEATAYLEHTKAVLATDVRGNPTKYNLAKVTEAVVGETIPTCNKYRDAYKKWRERKHAVEVHQAAINTLDHRRRALENLVTLWRSDYYAAPRERPAPDLRTADDNDLRTMDDVKRERAQTKVKIKRRKRRSE